MKPCTNSLSTVVEIGSTKTQSIAVRRGVLQGDPLSPLLFNMCIDFIFKDLNRAVIQEKFGFRVDDALCLTIFAFADGIVLVSRDRNFMQSLVSTAINQRGSIDLIVSGIKSRILDISYSGTQRTICQNALVVDVDKSIPAEPITEFVEYLGGKFRHNLQFDLGEEIGKFSEKIERLRGSEFLHDDQTLVLLKNYLWPTLIYKLQTAPKQATITKDL